MRLTGSGKPEGWEIPYLPGTLIVLPPAPIRQRVDRLRRKYDPANARLVPAHVTVSQPFRAEPGKPELDLVRQVLSGFEPFEANYGPLRNFFPYSCIWYEIQPAERILTIRSALHATGLFNTDLNYTEDFMPHMSITDGTPRPEEAEQLYDRIRGRVRGGTFLVTGLAYTRPDWQLRFGIVETLSLGGQRPAGPGNRGTRMQPG